MIQKTVGYKVGDTVCEGLPEAQALALEQLLSAEAAVKTVREVGHPGNIDIDVAAHCLVHNAEKVLDILTTTENSRPKARKTNGATRKPRTPKPLGAPPASSQQAA